ncbi:MAG: Rrf2 family transcriptional regulator [Hyphomicrobiaceae bacterium]|nr:Rrf2 family transcriptional regulator [Hyphomicrobiaceae bacterium]
MRPNKATTHALRILVACARSEGRLVKVASLSEALDLTPQNTFKMVHLLSRAGFIKAVRGRYGGVALARTASDIGVGDVVRAMEQLPEEADPEAPWHGVAPSGPFEVFDDALDAFLRVLNATSIADMAAASAGSTPGASGKSGPDGAKSGTAAKPAKRGKSTKALKSEGVRLARRGSVGAPKT